MRVRLVDLARLHAPFRAEIDAAIGRVVDSGRFVLGDEVEAFEREMAAALGVSHAVGVSSGSDALLAVLWAEGVGPGDEIVVPDLSFVATAEAVARLGGTPVFADVGDDGNLDPAAAAARVTERTRAVVAVDLFGRRADVGGAAGTPPVVVDAAQAVGPGVLRGARAATLSFFPTKNLGALGDGGLVATDDAALADAVRSLRVHGAQKKYVHERVGWNMRLDALQAAVLRVKLTRLGAWTEARRRIAAAYREGLAGLDGLALPEDAPGHVWHQFVVRVAEEARGGRDALRRHLAERGVETEVYYPLALHLQPCFADLGGRAGDHPRAEAHARRALALPIHPVLAPEEIAWVIEGVRSFFA
jgi:dTDP-4-amino-4,6-dideoxygalactose transaminase